MDDVLNNPAWNALISGNSNLSNGNHQVKYFDKAVSPFVGLKENSAHDFQLLYEMIPHHEPIGFAAPAETDIPAPWKVMRCVKALQMVCDTKRVLAGTSSGLVPLTDEHIPQMLALTKLTKPGPFAERTIDFGHYYGVFDGDKLVAMTGQRLHVFNYAEVSAVCTHPDYTGRGYARQLLINQVNRIKAASEIPFLHVRYDNGRAIKVYEDLGFSIRRDIYFYFLQKSV